MNPLIVRLDPSEYPQLLDLLILAFVKDPYFQYLFGGYPSLYEAVFRLQLQMQKELDQPVLGVKVGDRIVGAAIILEPNQEVPFPAFGCFLYSIFLEAGLLRVWRLLYSFMWVEKARHDLQKPHYYLSVLAIHPDFQRQGYGRSLLQEVHRFSENNPHSQGVWLEASVEQNFRFYERYGYQLQEIMNFGNTQLWLLFRPNFNK